MLAPIITFLTDFGLTDPSVGACRGVFATLAPGVAVADITHLVPPYAVEVGARRLEYALPYFPAGSVHVAVVDPGVGTARRGVALRSVRGDLLVGPDNGLLMWACDRLGGCSQAVELTNEEYRLHPTSRTFHARDIFCPAGAHLAVGVELGRLGSATDPETLQRLPQTSPQMGDGHATGVLSAVASFGNCHFDIYREHWRAAGLDGAELIEVVTPERAFEVPYVTTFGEVAMGEALLLHDSVGRLCLSINQGSAAEELGLRVGMEVTFRLPA